jgi:hypothetical protein
MTQETKTYTLEDKKKQIDLLMEQSDLKSAVTAFMKEIKKEQPKDPKEKPEVYKYL